jgi:hypothetical protein
MTPYERSKVEKIFKKLLKEKSKYGHQLEQISEMSQCLKSGTFKQTYVPNLNVSDEETNSDVEGGSVLGPKSPN